MDIVTLGLTIFLPPMIAGRVFLGIVLLLMLSGTVALHRTLHGRITPWPLIAAFFLYNWIFLFGFINYLFGIGVMLWGVAIWLAMARARAMPRLVVGTLLTVATLFCHLVAFGLFAIILGGLAIAEAFACWRCTRRLDLRSLLLAAIPVAIAVAVFVVLSPTADALGEPVAYAGWIGWKPLVAYRTLLWSIPWLNFATIGPTTALVVIAAFDRRVTFARRMTVPLALLCITFLVMPYSMSGALYADARLPIALLLVLISTLDLALPPLRILFAYSALATSLLIVRSAVITYDWHESTAVIRQFQEAFNHLPAGATLYVASAEPAPKLAYNSAVELARWHPPLRHVVSLASIGRDIFVPATWANRFQQPLSVLPGDVASKRLQGDGPWLTPTADTLLEALRQIRSLPASEPPYLQYLLLLRPASMTGEAPNALSPIAHGDSFTLFHIE